MKTGLIVVLGGLGVGLLGVRGCNMAFNNQTINKPAYTTHSYVTGIYGHIEYTSYSDGSKDVKIYPGFVTKFFDSELHQDLDGDGKVDRIRQNGAEWKMNTLSKLLVREEDYQNNKKRFDEADKELQELMRKYD